MRVSFELPTQTEKVVLMFFMIGMTLGSWLVHEFPAKADDEVFVLAFLAIAWFLVLVFARLTLNLTT